jgi:hypothetical protein
MPARGTTALYRPVPRDFDEVFVRVGWTSVCEDYGAGWKTVVKWLEIRNTARLRDGLLTLQDARSEWVRHTGPALSPKRIAEARPRSRAANYVLGRRTRRFTWPVPAPRFWDVGILPGVAAQSVPDRPRRVMLSPEKAARVIETAAKGVEASAEFLAGMARAAELLREQRGAM